MSTGAEVMASFRSWNALAAASASALPGICLPLVWDEVIASHQQPTVDVCRHLNAVGWRELEDFFRVVAADGERSQDSIHPGWAAARAVLPCAAPLLQARMSDEAPGRHVLHQERIRWLEWKHLFKEFAKVHHFLLNNL